MKKKEEIYRIISIGNHCFRYKKKNSKNKEEK